MTNLIIILINYLLISCVSENTHEFESFSFGYAALSDHYERVPELDVRNELTAEAHEESDRRQSQRICHLIVARQHHNVAVFHVLFEIAKECDVFNNNNNNKKEE